MILTGQSSRNFFSEILIGHRFCHFLSDILFDFSYLLFLAHCCKCDLQIIFDIFKDESPIFLDKNGTNSNVLT